jgi:hypothetical protein
LYELLTNETGAKTLQNNMNIVGPITYTWRISLCWQDHERNGMEAKGINGAIKPLEVKEKILQAVQLM